MVRSNQHESLSGIETNINYGVTSLSISCCNQHESLSGIETSLKLASWEQQRVLINMNPYQGLKLCRLQSSQ
jgi:hypothetical protein